MKSIVMRVLAKSLSCLMLTVLVGCMKPPSGLWSSDSGDIEFFTLSDGVYAIKVCSSINFGLGYEGETPVYTLLAPFDRSGNFSYIRGARFTSDYFELLGVVYAENDRWLGSGTRNKCGGDWSVEWMETGLSLDQWVSGLLPFKSEDADLQQFELESEEKPDTMAHSLDSPEDRQLISPEFLDALLNDEGASFTPLSDGSYLVSINRPDP